MLICKTYGNSFWSALGAAEVDVGTLFTFYSPPCLPPTSKPCPLNGQVKKKKETLLEKTSAQVITVGLSEDFLDLSKKKKPQRTTSKMFPVTLSWRNWPGNSEVTWSDDLENSYWSDFFFFFSSKWLASLNVTRCYFIITASSQAKFKPNPCAIMLCSWKMSLWRETVRTREAPACICLSLFHLSSDVVSFLSPAVGIYWTASFRDPVEYSIKLQGGEKSL